MSTTTVTANSFGVHAPEPTDRMRQAVELRDAGKSNAEVGEAMGCTAGSAGNLIVNGLRRMGREVASTGNGPKAPTVTKPRTRAEIIAAALEQELVKLHTARERHEQTMREAIDAAEAFDGVAWAAEQIEAREAAIKAAQADLKAFKAEAESHAEAELERLRTNRDAVVPVAEAAISELDEAIATFADES